MVLSGRPRRADRRVEPRPLANWNIRRDTLPAGVGGVPSMHPSSGDTGNRESKIVPAGLKRQLRVEAGYRIVSDHAEMDDSTPFCPANRSVHHLPPHTETLKLWADLADGSYSFAALFLRPTRPDQGLAAIPHYIDRSTAEMISAGNLQVLRMAVSSRAVCGRSGRSFRGS